ncbi:MAG: class I SAM-dependent methyltransferase [Myxococcota bacterium]|nr:class I SAM-dependent methyltransferase [Myxococcota bacterium]
MSERLYADLADWWPWLAPLERYPQEAQLYLRLLGSVAGELNSLLELGSGTGHLAAAFPGSLDVELLDLSPTMIRSSQRNNPSRKHHLADLRVARLERSFDAVLLHDAVMYMTTEADLRAALETAAVHVREGGAVLVKPDVVAETFQEGTNSGGTQGDGRAAQLLEWHWDPDPTDDQFQVDMAFLLRDERGEVRCVHDQHTMGLFSRDRWCALLREVGLHLAQPDPLDMLDLGDVFLCRRTRA